MLPYGPSTAVRSHTAIPIARLDQAQAQRLFQKYRDMGYRVERGTLAQLRQLIVAENTPTPDRASTGGDGNSRDSGRCKKSESSSSENPPQGSRPQSGKTAPSNTTPADAARGCSEAPATGKNNKPMAVTMPRPAAPENKEPASAPAQPAASPVQPGVGVNIDVVNTGGSGSSESAKIFFILSGIVVVASFVVYAGKYIVDIINGKQHDLWWEVIYNATIMDTQVGQHGNFNGVKIATGFVSSDLFQVGLLGEIGSTDLKLVFDENTAPTTLDFSGSYWMVGATARLHLTNSMVNASYLFLDFMGGSTSDSNADTIGAARAGMSFGINRYLRLGASIGAQYIGLRDTQGFINNSDKYWYTYGVEVGARF